MRYLADLHIHSHYSRATSKNLNLENLHLWGQIKGLDVIATGDISHPKWLAEMREKLEPSADGLYRLKSEYVKTVQDEVPKACTRPIDFILSGEISSIYKKGGQVRKIHNVVFLPSLDSVEKFQEKLDRIGNIHSDGRPILGLDSRDLLEILLETDENAQLIPAHIWTPWFALMGSKSGFDSVEECFDDLSSHIFALETGLSSDPPMNWRLSQLDRYSLVSNSDAHSPAKLAREANVFDTDRNYHALFNALKNKDADDFWGTLEFFPEEGKYHMDGHRVCKKMLRPKETIELNGNCPVCGKPVTLGVNYRVEQLADRDEGFKPENAKPFKSLVPLPEVLSEVVGVGPNSKKVQGLYFSLLNELGSELDILLELPISDIEQKGNTLIAEGIKRMREGNIQLSPGYDGEFGTIQLFESGEKEQIIQQNSLFDFASIKNPKKKVETEPETQKETMNDFQPAASTTVQEMTSLTYGLNEQQLKAINHTGSPLVIQAGPGTGKTKTLTERIATLVEDGTNPEHILAITFTNKAADEMRERLEMLIQDELIEKMTISTFHAFGVSILRYLEKFDGRTENFSIINPTQDENFKKLLSERVDKINNNTLENIAFCKGQGYTFETIPDEHLEKFVENFADIYQKYDELLEELDAVDYEDLIRLPVKILRNDPDIRRYFQEKYPAILVDEFQDINPIQYELFKLFAITAKEMCVIGDPNQAIYGFRGANRKFFIDAAKEFNATQIKLTRNYRSTQNILSASVQMLEKRQVINKKQLWSEVPSDIKITIHNAASDRAEAEYIVQQIEKLVGGTSSFSHNTNRVDDREQPAEIYSFSDFTILLRTKRLAPPIIEALTRSGIPFESFDENYYMWSEHIKDFISWIKSTHDAANNIKAVELVKTYLSEHDFEKEDALQFKKLVQFAEPYGQNIQQFLDTLLLNQNIDHLDDRADRVRILTMHAAKGLEFPIVFIVGCEESIIPFKIPGQETNLEEERRLLYVGMTRAKRQLFLSHARKRFVFGAQHQNSPSQFLKPIHENLLHREVGVAKLKPSDDQISLF